MESLEKEIIVSREMGKGVILAMEKKAVQNLGHEQECLILSLSWPQEKTQPTLLAPNLALVHQWLEIVRICVKVRAKDLLEPKT